MDFTKKLFTPRIWLENNKLRIQRVPWARGYKIIYKERDVITNEYTGLEFTEIFEDYNDAQIYNTTQYRYLNQLPLVNTYNKGVQTLAKYLDYNTNEYVVDYGYSYGLLFPNYSNLEGNDRGVGIGHIDSTSFLPYLIDYGKSNTLNWRGTSNAFIENSDGDKYSGNKIVATKPFGTEIDGEEIVYFYAFILKDIRIPIRTNLNCDISVVATVNNIDTPFGILEDSDRSNNVVINGDYIDVPNKVRIFLYNNTSENNRLNKNDFLTFYKELTGVFRENTSIINPTIQIENNELPKSNYCYIPKFNRFYYIQDIECVTNNLYILYCSVDVLMSNKDTIRELNGFIIRQENLYDSDIVDDKLPAKSMPNVKIDNGFSRPIIFNSNYQCVLLQLSYYPDVSGVVTTSEEYIENSYTPYNIMSTFYACTLKNLMKFTDGLWGEGFRNALKNLFNNPQEFVINAILYPFNISQLFDSGEYHTVAVDKVLVGRSTFGSDYTLEVGDGCRWLYRTNKAKFTLHIDTINRIYNNFLDYPPYTKGTLYVPFYGFIDIDINLVIGKEIEIVYYVELANGSAQFNIETLYTEDDNIKKTIIYTGSCQVGVEINLSSSNVYENRRKNLMTAINTVGNLVNMGHSKNIFDISTKRMDKRTKEYKDRRDIFNEKQSSNITNLVTQTTCDLIQSNISHYDRGHISNGFTNFYMQKLTDVNIDADANVYTLRPYLIRYCVEPSIDIDDYNYRHTIGRPYCKSNKIGNVTGFTKISAIHLDGLNCTENEKEMIKDILYDGFLV